ncbi:DUF4870 domain-containing protein [Tenuifilum osseticum]|uniref:DUF4870 domain-containing protein n=1 Tax=Tenuifilum osseticum TaxID=3374723 RepID=UPI0034E45E20
MENITYTSNDERTFSMLCHLSALSGLIIPFGHIIGPLVVWLLKKEEFPEVDRQGKAALNFQLSLTIYSIVAGILVIFLVGFVLLGAIFLLGLILTIIASVKSSNGERFEYPLSINLIK